MALRALQSDPPLRVLVAGRAHAGKTCLVAHLKRYAAQPASQPPPRSPPSPSFLAQRRPRSRVPFLLHRALHVLSNVLSPQLHQRRAIHHLLQLHDQSRNTPMHVWESVGEYGVAAVAADPHARFLDVVLFVTRLDCSRVAKYDKQHLSHLCQLFGQQLVNKLIFVLTRGSSLPPINLTFSEFVKLRSDLLYLHVKQVFYPVQVSGGVGIKYAPDLVPQHLQQQQNAQREPALTEAALNRLEKSITRQWLRRKPTAAVDKLHSVLVNDDSTDAGSTTDLPDTFLDDLFLSGVYPLDRRVFVDPPRPRTVVVELADSAPTNEAGDTVLPDGSAWIHSLVHAMVSTANSVRAQRQRSEREQLHDPFKPEPLSWWRRLHREIVCGGIRTMVMSVAFVYLGMYTYLQMVDRHRRWKEAQDDDDVLLKLDDEEFERLTKPDPGTDGSVILKSGPEPPAEEELKDEEKEFFGAKEEEVIKNEVPEVKGVGPLAENQASGKDGDNKPEETKGGDVHLDWDKLEDDERMYSKSYTLENEREWKHLVPNDD